MAEALTLLESGAAQARHQDPAMGETLRVIPAELLAAVRRRLAAGRYSHFSG